MRLFDAIDVSDELFYYVVLSYVPKEYHYAAMLEYVNIAELLAVDQYAVLMTDEIRGEMANVKHWEYEESAGGNVIIQPREEFAVFLLGNGNHAGRLVMVPQEAIREQSGFFVVVMGKRYYWPVTPGDVYVEYRLVEVSHESD